ncbi:ATP-binding protein [Clostridium cylindrosporum]|nr:ATP-binding protein [Clostridium cylindrosporum]
MEQFILFDSFNNSSIIQNLIELKKEYKQEVYNKTLSELLREGYRLSLEGNILKSYICYLISNDENPLTLMAEHKGKNVESAIYNIALKDIEKIVYLFNTHMEFCNMEDKGNSKEEKILSIMNNNEKPEDILDQLLELFYKNGAGLMNRYKAFKWSREVGLIGIDKCDPITFDELIGYERQRSILVKNTEEFLKGNDANNVLLFGDSGTGKSSSIKALLNKYSSSGLRVLELNKSDFMDLNNILSVIGNRGVKFILFLDDLSFEEFESEYKNMKALIEGGVEVKPKNILIYATSNRRHLIRETWNDRQGEDIHVSDTRQEKYSLSERFGITLTYTSASQVEYLNIVMELAKIKGIDIQEDILKEKALQWAALNTGRSGRIAKQFIMSLNTL